MGATEGTKNNGDWAIFKLATAGVEYAINQSKMSNSPLLMGKFQSTVLFISLSPRVFSILIGVGFIANFVDRLQDHDRIIR